MKRIIYKSNEFKEWTKIKVDLSTTPPKITKLRTTVFEKKHGYPPTLTKN